jgi:hypothetical protein
MDDIISKYHTPDSTWKIWSVHSYGDFIKRFVVQGRFHNHVPSLISNEYPIVERLLCYSYYHYFLIDEAYSKATRIFESAIIQRVNDLGIENKNKYESLEKKINKLKLYTSDEIFMDLNNIRKVRNILAHPSPGQNMGIIIARGFLKIINVINKLFLDLSIINLNDFFLTELKSKSEHLKEGICTFEYNCKNILIYSIFPYACTKSDKILKSLWVFHPVYTDFPQNMEELTFRSPLIYRLKDVEITDEEFKAVDLSTGKSIKAIITNKVENLESLKKFKSLVSSSDEDVKIFNSMNIDSEISYDYEKFLYDECWI